MVLPLDLSGHTFERVVVLSRVGKTKHGNLTWLCKCQCGTEFVASSGHLRSVHTQSCGCLVREKVAKFGLSSRLSHGHCASRGHSYTYTTWHAMKSR